MNQPPPKSPQTVEDLIRGLGSTFTAGMQALGARVTSLEETFVQRLDQHEVRITKVEARGDKSSLRAGAIAAETSSADLAHEAQLAAHQAKLDALDEKMDAQTALLRIIVRASERPIVKLLATAIAAAVLSWLGIKGIR